MKLAVPDSEDVREDIQKRVGDLTGHLKRFIDHSNSTSLTSQIVISFVYSTRDVLKRLIPNGTKAYRAHAFPTHFRKQVAEGNLKGLLANLIYCFNELSADKTLQQLPLKAISKSRQPLQRITSITKKLDAIPRDIYHFRPSNSQLGPWLPPEYSTVYAQEPMSH